MTATNNKLLRFIIRQNDLILHGLSMVLDTVDFTLERTFEMADDLDDVVEDVGKQTEIQEGVALVIDHAVSLLDDLDAKLDAAGQDPAKIAAIRTGLASSRDKLSAKKEELAAAVTRNTPFDPSAA